MDKLRYGVALAVILAVVACSGDRPDTEPQVPPQTVGLSFGSDFIASKIAAFSITDESQNTQRLLIIGESSTGKTAEILINDINKELSSFSVEKGAAATFAIIENGDKCTTALTMENDSSISIEQHDPAMNFVEGSFNGLECKGEQTQEIGPGKFAVNYEVVLHQNSLSLALDGEEVIPAQTFVSITPEPLNTIQITGFNGGTESYTLILNKDLPAGTYEMNEFDVAPYFFFSDAARNQFNATGGTVTLDDFDAFSRVLSGSFDVTTSSGSDEVHSTGEFEVFIF